MVDCTRIVSADIPAIVVGVVVRGVVCKIWLIAKEIIYRCVQLLIYPCDIQK